MRRSSQKRSTGWCKWTRTTLERFNVVPETTKDSELGEIGQCRWRPERVL